MTYILKQAPDRTKMTQQTNGKDALIDRLIDLAAQTGIVHHIPGRIRLKVKLSGLLLARDLDAADLMKYFNGILDARANAAARSIVIGYDERVIDPDFWNLLVNLKKDPGLRCSVREQLQRLSRPGLP
jgi:hypothetical protein